MCLLDAVRISTYGFLSDKSLEVFNEDVEESDSSSITLNLRSFIVTGPFHVAVDY